VVPGLRVHAGPGGGQPPGPAAELFTVEHGQATVFIPCTGQIRPVGRTEPLLVPPAELAIILHDGPPDGITAPTAHWPRT
jgi:hypothetical protein